MNFSFSELILIFAVALIVIKPEQLPGVALVLGRFAKSIRDIFNKTKNEVNGFIESVEKSDGGDRK